jgi:hypothetical protein
MVAIIGVTDVEEPLMDSHRALVLYFWTAFLPYVREKTSNLKMIDFGTDS